MNVQQHGMIICHVGFYKTASVSIICPTNWVFFDGFRQKNLGNTNMNGRYESTLPPNSLLGYLEAGMNWVIGVLCHSYPASQLYSQYLDGKNLAG